MLNDVGMYMSHAVIHLIRTLLLLLLLLLLHLSSTQVPAQLCLIGKRDPRRNPNRGQ